MKSLSLFLVVLCCCACSKNDEGSYSMSMDLIPSEIVPVTSEAQVFVAGGRALPADEARVFATRENKIWNQTMMLPRPELSDFSTLHFDNMETCHFVGENVEYVHWKNMDGGRIFRTTESFATFDGKSYSMLKYKFGDSPEPVAVISAGPLYEKFAYIIFEDYFAETYRPYIACLFISGDISTLNGDFFSYSGSGDPSSYIRTFLTNNRFDPSFPNTLKEGDTIAIREYRVLYKRSH